MVFEAVVDKARQEAEVIVFDISPGTLVRGLRYHIKRAAKVARAVFGLFASRRRSNTLYHNVDAGMGLIYSLAIAATARLLSYRCFLHHHSYSYINKYDRLFDWIARIGGRGTIHIALAESMSAALRARYPGICQSIVLGNASFLDPQAVPDIPAERPLVLGHLSRLGTDKGLPDVLRTYDMLAEKTDVHLILAGPPDNDDSIHAIENMISRYPKRVQWLGAVSGERKVEFYESIDVFLFPTRNEAQPLVLLEALEAGRPSIAFARGTIAEMLLDSGGLSVNPSEDFAMRAVPLLTLWSSDRDGLIAAGERACERFASILRQANDQMADLLRHLTDLSLNRRP
jgi:glycosyltransferase involved in cell wall biosynthesis